MYRPFDPNKISNSWEKLQQSFLEHKHAYIVVDEKKNPKTKKINISLDFANKLIIRMQQADYVRLGSSRLISMPPHFAINFYDINKGKLTELITMNDDFSEISHALDWVIQLSFYQNRNLMELTIPLIVDGLVDSDMDIITDRINNCMVVRRIIKDE